MEYGANNIRVGKITAEPAAAMPTYDGAILLGELNQLADNPSYVEAKAAGDNNALARYIKAFSQATVDVTVLDLSNEVASMVLGATIESGSQKGLSFSGNDMPPYVGLGFFTQNLMAGNQVKYQAIFYPKCKASMQGKTYDTKGESIALSNSKLQFTASVCNKDAKWKMESEYLDTEAEAEAWLEAIMPMAVSST